MNLPLKKLKTQAACKQKADTYIKQLNRKYTRRGTFKGDDFSEDSFDKEAKKSKLSEKDHDLSSPELSEINKQASSPGFRSGIDTIDSSKRRRTTLVFTYNKQSTKKMKDPSNVFYPDSKLICFWDGLMTTILLITCIHTPYQVAF